MLFVLAALALTAQPTATPPASPPAGAAQPADGGAMMPPPAFMSAAQAFGTCVQTAAAAVPATTSADAGAAQALASCASQKAAMQAAFETWLMSPSFPAAAREPARAQLAERLSTAPARVAEQITRARAGGAAAPAATPGN